MDAVYILIRRTVDWRDEAAFRAQLDPRFSSKVDLWDATFSIPFHLFRARVAEIAEESRASVRGARRAAWDDIPDGALVIPTDDDDWLGPDVAEVLEAVRDAGTIGYWWNASFVQVPIDAMHGLSLVWRAMLLGGRPKLTCESNNYAFVKRAAMGRRLVRHGDASAWFDGAGARAVRHIARGLSVQNRTLASQTSLAWRKPAMNRRQLLRKYWRYRTLYEQPVAGELAWCRPYLAGMAALTTALGLRNA